MKTEYPTKVCVLVFDAHARTFLSLTSSFRQRYDVRFSSDLKSFRTSLVTRSPSVVLVSLESELSQTAIQESRLASCAPAIIVMGQAKDNARVVQAFERGAKAHVPLPLDCRVVERVIEAEQELLRCRLENENLKAKLRFGDFDVPGSKMEDIEKLAILRTLASVDWSTAKAAKILGISVRKIQYRLSAWKNEKSEGDWFYQRRRFQHLQTQTS